MSAIAAILHTDGAAADETEIQRMMSALRAFGPERTVTQTYGHVALGFGQFTTTREDIAQIQPITGGDGVLTMVFDGRLDNRPDLARELGIEPAELRLLSDGGLAMRSWERWGQDAIQRWVGVFAVILWDRQNGQLLAFSDHLGSRSLFYHNGAGRIAIASAPMGLHALADIPRELDDQKLADMLCDFDVDTRATYFRGVRRIAPGHMMVVTETGAEEQRFYDLSVSVQPVRLASDEEYVEAASELLGEIVEQQMRSPGPVGAFMSGGLDSSTVAIFASRNLPAGQQLQTYTSVPEAGWDGITDENAYGDESPYVQAIAAAHPAIQLNLVDSAGLGLFHRMDQLLRLTEAPVRNSLNLIWFHEILDKARSDGMRVMLQGSQGNLTLSYTGDGVLTDLWRQRRFGRMLRELSANSTGPLSFARLAMSRLLLPMAPHWVWRIKEAVRGRRVPEFGKASLVARDFAHDMGVLQRIEDRRARRSGRQAADAQAQITALLTGNLMPKTADAERGLMSLYGIDLRDPMADRRLVEWRLGVPEDQFQRNGQRRWLIKRMMKDALPDDVLNKPRDVGRQSADWHVRMTRDLPEMRSRLDAIRQDPVAARMLDLDGIDALLKDWPAGTVTMQTDQRRVEFGVTLPLALQVAQFTRLVRGVNR